MGTNRGRKNHYWGGIQQIAGAARSAVPRGAGDPSEIICQHCQLHEQKLYLLNDDGRPTRGTVWVRPQGGVIAVRPYAFSSNYRPRKKPTRTWAAAFVGVPVERRPECPKDPDEWLNNSETYRRPLVAEES